MKYINKNISNELSSCVVSMPGYQFIRSWYDLPENYTLEIFISI